MSARVWQALARLQNCAASTQASSANSSLATKTIKTSGRHTLSIPSISLARLTPLGGGGAAELRSSLPLAELPGASEPSARLFVDEATEGFW